MKKLLFILTILTTFMLANDNDIYGTITNIDNNNKTITVNNNKIKVLQYTEIEKEACGMVPMDLNIKFSELKVNDFVEVDVFYQNNEIVAESIEVKCNKQAF